jgi:hypothetical protein
MKSHREIVYKGYHVIAKASRSSDAPESGYVGSHVVQRGAMVCWSRTHSEIYATPSAALSEALALAKVSIQQALRRRWVERMRTLPGSAFEPVTGF